MSKKKKRMTKGSFSITKCYLHINRKPKKHSSIFTYAINNANIMECKSW